MPGLSRTYGLGLAALIWALLGTWLLVLVIAPQVTMIEQSLWSIDTTGHEITGEIDRLYNEMTTAKYDWEHADSLDARAVLDLQIQRLSVQIGQLEEMEHRQGRVYGLQNYAHLSSLHLAIFLKTVVSALGVTLVTLALCYPIAVASALSRHAGRTAILMVVLCAPFALNELLRIYAWLMILDQHGLINEFLIQFGLVSRPLPLLDGPAAVLLALAYAHVLFMVFPIHAALSAIDGTQIDAARDLGAGLIRRHRRIILPQARPGILVGIIMTFMLSVGSYSVPRIMTRGQGGDWFSQLIYRQFFEADNWNVGAAYAVTLVISVMVLIVTAIALFRLRLGDFGSRS